MGLTDSIRRLSNSLGLSRSDPNSSQNEIDLNKLQESESDSDIEDAEIAAEEDQEEDEEGEDEEDVPLSDAELDSDADVVPYQKVTVNNQAALRRSLQRIALPSEAKNSFEEHVSITSKGPLELRDIYDDTERELGFYKQALAAAIEGRRLAKAAGMEFSRPVDYFAEMVKSDEHMQRVKGKLVASEKQKRVAQEARKQRELKKYGKKVQHEKLQQRAKDKRDMLDKIQGLKRKRSSGGVDNDQFQVQVEDALSDKTKARDDKFRLGKQNRLQPGKKRQTKNAKYGSGHRKGERRNTADSSMDVSDFNNKRRKRK